MILDNKLVIKDLDKLKITSIKHDGGVIHFSYDGKHYTFLNGGTDCTLVMALYEGQCKSHLKHISSKYGMALDLIQYKHNKTTLSSINKELFVKVLQKHGFVKIELLNRTGESSAFNLRLQIAERKRRRK